MEGGMEGVGGLTYRAEGWGMGRGMDGGCEIGALGMPGGRGVALSLEGGKCFFGMFFIFQSAYHLIMGW